MILIRTGGQLGHQITVDLGTLGPPAVTDGNGQSPGGNIELQVHKCVFSFFDDTLHGVFLIIIGVVIGIDLGLIFQVDPFGLKVVQDVLLDGVRQPVLKVEQSLLSQVGDLVMLCVPDRADSDETGIDHFTQGFVNVKEIRVALVQDETGELGVGQRIFIDTVQHVEYDDLV